MKVHHVAICVTNLSESISFYFKYFGFSEKQRFRKEEFEANFCIIENDGFEIELFAFDRKVEKKNEHEDLLRTGIRHLAFEVSDISKEIERLENSGLTFSKVIKGKSGNLYAFCNDPDGVQLELLEVIS